jgi:flagellar motor protein MotB
MTYAGFGGNWQGMLQVLRAKFTSRSESANMMALMLKQTGDHFLLEHNSVPDRDKVWSNNSDGTGTNWLGLQLMIIRDELNGSSTWPNSWTAWIKKNVNMDTGALVGHEWQDAVKESTRALQQAINAGRCIEQPQPSPVHAAVRPSPQNPFATTPQGKYDALPQQPQQAQQAQNDHARVRQQEAELKQKDEEIARLKAQLQVNEIQQFKANGVSGGYTAKTKPEELKPACGNTSAGCMKLVEVKPGGKAAPPNQNSILTGVYEPVGVWNIGERFTLTRRSTARNSLGTFRVTSNTAGRTELMSDIEFADASGRTLSMRVKSDGTWKELTGTVSTGLPLVSILWTNGQTWRMVERHHNAS